MKIKKDSLTIVPLFLVFFNTFLSSLAAIVIPNGTIRIFLQVLGVVLFACCLGKFDLQHIELDIQALFCILLSLLLLYGYLVNEVYRGTFAIYFITIIFCLLAKNRENWLKSFILLNAIFGIFYIVTTIIMRLNNSLYYKIVPSLYPTETRFRYWYESGFMTGITEHYTTNGCMLSTALIFTFGCFIAAVKRQKWRKLYAILSLLSLICLFLAGKRAHILFSVIGLLIAYYCYESGEKNRFVKYLLILTCICIGIFWAYSFIPQVQLVLSRFIGMGDDENLLIRYNMWEKAFEAFKSNPIFGVGWFGFGSKVAMLASLNNTHAHNVYIQVLCETGIIGTIIIYSWFIYSIVSIVKFLSYIGKNKMEYGYLLRTWAYISMAFQVYFLFYCLTENPLYDAYVYPVYYALSITTISLKKKYMVKRCEGSV